MNYRNSILAELLLAAENPENEFDEILSANRKYIAFLSTDSLGGLISLRAEFEQLNKSVPYSREDISILLESGEADLNGKFALKVDNLNTAEYIFSSVNGKDF